MFENLLATGETAAETSGDNAWMMWVIGIAVVLLIAAMVVLPMITNKKRAKAENEKRNMLSVGDTVMTIGGIVGTIKEIKEPAPGRKEFVLQTGSGETATTITFDIKALYTVLNSVNPAVTASKPSAHTSAENIALKETAPTEEPSDPSTDKK